MQYPKKQKNLIRVLFSVLFLFVFQVQSFATIWYVKPISTGSGNGTSWTNANQYLSTVLTNAVAGDEIWLSKGTYYNYQIGLKSGVKIYGGFSGNGNETSINDRDLLNNETVFSAPRVTCSETLNNSTILDAISFVGIGPYQVSYTALTISNSSLLTLSHCKFYNLYNNSNSFLSGALVITGSSAPIITDCIFYNNTSVNGSAIFIVSPSTPTILNCTFTNNNCTDANGAAIYLAAGFSSGNITYIKNSIVYNNTPLEIKESVVIGNLSVSFSDIKNGYTGTGNINQDPLFKDASNGNLRLMSTSPCLQVGDNASYSNLNTSFDILNHPRLSLNTAGTSSNIDMGAYQFSNAPTSLKYNSPNLYTKDIAISNLTPYVDGLAPISYTIDKTLPLGLSMNGSTGVISGTPSAVFTPTIFTITASNSAGTSSSTVHIAVDIPKPSISYTTPVSYTISKTISPSLSPVNTGGSVLGGVSTVPKKIPLGINAPSGIVFDQSGNLYILSTSSSSSNSIYKLTPSGNLSVFVTGINNVNTTGMAIDANDNIYVANKSTKNIHKITPSGSVSVFVNGGSLTDPRGMVVGNDGYLYVANNSANTIVKVDLTNGNQSVFATNVANILTWDGGPLTIDMDQNNFIYVINGDGSVSKIDPSGTVDKNFAPDNFSTGSALGMDIDANGIIYISGKKSNLGGYGSVQKINQIGDQVEHVKLMGAEHFTNGMKFNANGDLYQVVSTLSSYLNVFERGKYSIATTLPAGLSFDNQTGLISGTPTAITPASTYTVTATNGVGSSSFTIDLEVKGSILYTSPNIYTKGTAITSLTPNTNGVSANTYSITPTLPSGLSIDGTTGVISGTPTALSAQAEYTVRAVTTTGNLEGKLTITVNDIAPSNLSYTTPNVFTKGTAIIGLTPSVVGGAVVNYTITPSLPAGLSINAVSGVILGTPTVVTNTGVYTVTATNTGGTVSFGLSITVNDIPPSNLSYSSPKIYTKGTAITTLSPTITGGAVISYSVNPTLPAGLNLNALNGNITGTPTIIAASSIYTITATNSGGSSSFGVEITVNDIPPSGISYVSPTILFKNMPSNGLTPSQTGGGVVTHYTITPALPTGLTFDTISGVITGTSTVLSDPTDYTVTATNSGGSTTALLNIKVILFLFAKDSIIQHNNCVNDSIGEILVTAQGGYAPYLFSMNGGAYQSTGSFKKLPSGIYRFSLKDATGAEVQITDTVKTLSSVPIKTYFSQINNKCFGDALGAITIDSITGGVAPFKYLWSSGTNVANGIVKLAKGEYLFNLQDFYGCQDSAKFIITEPDKLIVNTTVTDPLCYNQSNGILSANVSGGTASYTYLWSNGGTTNRISNLAFGAYSLKVTDAMGCVKIDSINLQNPLPFKIELDSIVTICTNQIYKKDFKNSNYPTAVFNWTSDNGYTSTSSILSVNKAGTYFVKGMNPNGCISMDTLVMKKQNNTIESVFAVATNVFQYDTIHIVNISNPKPDKSIWTYSIDTAVKLIFKNEDSLRLKFSNEGTYYIQLNTKMGACVDSSIQTVHILKSSGINVYNIAPLGLNSIQNLKISPNPNRGLFNVSLNLQKSSSIAIRILNISNGRLVYSKQYHSSTYFNIPFNLLLSADIYALIIETEFGATSVSKIMIL